VAGFLSIKVSVARFMIHTVQPAAAGLRSVRRSLVTAVAGVWGAAPLCSALGVGSSRLARGPGAANEAPSGFWMVNMGPASTTPAAGTQDTQDSQDTPKTHLRLSFPPLPTRRRSFLGVGAVIPSDRLQAASHQFQENQVSSWPIQPRSGQVWRCGAVLPATVATRQPMASRRRSGISSLEAGWAGSGGRFFFRLRGRIEHGSG
jgi:hypothetical protein